MLCSFYTILLERRCTLPDTYDWMSGNHEWMRDNLD